MKSVNTKTNSWKKHKLGDLVFVINGLWSGKSDEKVLCNVIRNTNFTNFGKLSLVDTAIVEVDRKSLESRGLIKEDIILEKSGGSDSQPVGRVVYFDLNEKGYSFSNFTACLRPDSKKINSKYLFYFLYNLWVHGGTREIQRQTTGIRNLNMSEYLRLEVPTPSAETQQKIASILSTIDEAIQKTDQIIEKTEKLKNQLSNNLLSEGLNASDLKESKFGRIPSDWKIIKLHEIIKKLDAGVSVNSENKPAQEGEIGILKTSAVTYGAFNANENKKVVEKDISRVSVSPKNDHIIFSRMNTPLLVGASVYVDKDYPNLFLPDRLWQIELVKESNVFVKWLSYYLGWDKTRERICELATGTSASMKNISKEKLMNFEMALPSFEEQVKIANILDSISEKLKQENRTKNNIILLKTGLMNDIFNQKVEVKNEHCKSTL